MHELQLEKARLKLELVKTEDKIKGNYHHILSAFSLRNIFSTVTSEIASPSSLLMKSITLFRNWLGKQKKKKKQDKNQKKILRDDPDEGLSD
ncbi:MAG: hypothetical protein ABSD71_13150 [Bacteroidales bacterium]|jgi:hypothetical protein